MTKRRWRPSSGGCGVNGSKREIAHLKAHRLKFELQLIFGLPGETLASFRKSLDYASSLDPDLLAVFPLMVLPGTELWRKAREIDLRFDPEPPYVVRSHFSMTADDMAYGAKIMEALEYLRNSKTARFLSREPGLTFAGIIDSWIAWREEDAGLSSRSQSEAVHRAVLRPARARLPLLSGLRLLGIQRVDRIGDRTKAKMAPDRTNGIRSRAVETHAADDVHVRYRFTDPLDEATVRAAMSLLSDEERTRHDRFRARRDRDEYAVAHALLRTTLSMVGDRPPAAWRFTAGPQGKPAIADAVANEGLAFNLSHTRGLVACAVSRGIDVGIDVEAVTRAIDWRPIAARYFSPEEVAEIDRVDPPAQAIRFFEIWTLKEAFIKAVGTGLSQPLKAMTFSLEPREPVGFVPPAGVSASLWHFGLYAPAASHRLAVAVSDGTPRVRRIHVQDDLHSTG